MPVFLSMSEPANHNIFISIIIPLYNAERYIETALSKIEIQRCCNYEVLLLDACSTDATAALAHKWVQRDKRFQWHAQKDAGIYDAMNRGIALAKGEWLYFMGCDDSFVNEFVLEQIQSHLASDVDLVYGNIMWMPVEIMEEGEWALPKLLRQNINHQRIFYRKTLFEKWGNYELRYKVASDQELNIRFFCNAQVKKKYVPVIIAHYHAGGFSAAKTDEVFWDNWNQTVLQPFKPHLPLREIYNQLSWYCWYNIDKKKYIKATVLFIKILIHTRSFTFFKVTTGQLLGLHKPKVRTA